MLPIGERIRNLRREKNETQEDLSLVLGVSYQAVSRWENGDAYPDIELLPKLAAHYSVTTDELLGADEETVQAERKKQIEERKDELIVIRPKAKTAEEKRTVYVKARDAFKAFPEELYFAYVAASCLLADIMPREEALPEFRTLCSRMLDQSVPVWRFFALRMIYLYEEEEKLQEYWKYVPPYPFTRDSLLAERYAFRGELERHRIKRKENLFETLRHTFEVEFHDDTPEGTAASAQAILKIIDTLRDTADDRDAWLAERIRYNHILAAAFDRLGQKESCFRALDTAVTLCELCFTIPEDEPLLFHSPILDPVAVTRRFAFEPEHGKPPAGDLLYSNLKLPLFELLASPSGWPKPGYWDDPSFKSVTDRIGVMHDREFQ